MRIISAMPIISLLVGSLLLGAGGAHAQQSPLGSGLNSGLNSGLSSSLRDGIGSGLYSGLGVPTPRTMADPFNPNRVPTGGSCAPGQIDPDFTGCRPAEWLRGETANANRVVTYVGDSAFRAPSRTDPNRLITPGDSGGR